MPPSRSRPVSLAGALACLLASLIAPPLLVACQTPDVPRAVPASVIRERLRKVEPGQTLDEVHAILKSDPVRKPGHAKEPFASPLHRVELRAPDGRAVLLETYVVATRPQKGCPDFLYEDVPVVYVDGVVAVLSWEEVEWNWRSWGGGLDRLRWIQDRHRCPEELEGPEV